jgi:crotonobetainyl-CoA:carnitine CoA-transferase CaiB-like acyl-CoA transferase
MTTTGPLRGFTIVDLSRYGTGRYCTMLLADYGAEVITIETPRLDSSLPSFMTDDICSRYLAFNRNKKSVAINLAKEQGREILYRLIKTADVLVEGYRPGVTKKLRVDYETLKSINPGLIYCSISGFGQDGPYAYRSGHDLNYLGISGILSLTGPEEGPPSIIGTQVADLVGGFCQATIAVLMALLEREESGKGQYIDLAILDGLIHALWLQGADYLLTGKLPQKGETILTGLSAGYNIYLTLDNKYLTLGCYEPWFWKRLCQIIGREDFVEHQNAQGEKRKGIFTSFKKIFKTKTRAEWLKILNEADIPCGPVNDLAETFSDPQVIHRKMVVEVNHPRLGKIKQIGIPIKLSRTPGRIKNLSPRYGEHTTEILKEIGYTEEVIQDLRRNKIIE